MSSSEEDSEYEPSLRSLNTSDDTASSSDNNYFSTSEEGGEERAWRSLELSEEHMNAAPPRFLKLTHICLQGYFQNKKLVTKIGKNNNSKLFSQSA